MTEKRGQEKKAVWKSRMPDLKLTKQQAKSGLNQGKQDTLKNSIFTQKNFLLKNQHEGWSNSTAGTALALHRVAPDSIPGYPYGAWVMLVQSQSQKQARRTADTAEYAASPNNKKQNEWVLER